MPHLRHSGKLTPLTAQTEQHTCFVRADASSAAARVGSIVAMPSMSPHSNEAEDGLDCMGVDVAEKGDLCFEGELRRRARAGEDAEGRTAGSSFSRRRL